MITCLSLIKEPSNGDLEEWYKVDKYFMHEEAQQWSCKERCNV